MVSADILFPLISSTIAVITTQSEVAVQQGKLITNDDISPPSFDIGGVVDIKEGNISFSFYLFFPQKLYLTMRRMDANEILETKSGEILEGVSEIINTVYGMARKQINEKGHDMQLATPRPIQGPIDFSEYASKEKKMILPFKTEIGEFYMLLTPLEEKQ